MLRCRTIWETELVGALLACVGKPGKPVFLKGELGVGKSVVARGFVRAFVGDESLIVPSPTFLVANSYSSEANMLTQDIECLHIDLYRVQGRENLASADIPFVFDTCAAIVEWSDRLMEAGVVVEDAIEVLVREVPEDDDARDVLFLRGLDIQDSNLISPTHQRHFLQYDTTTPNSIANLFETIRKIP